MNGFLYLIADKLQSAYETVRKKIKILALQYQDEVKWRRGVVGSLIWLIAPAIGGIYGLWLSLESWMLFPSLVVCVSILLFPVGLWPVVSAVWYGLGQAYWVCSILHQSGILQIRRSSFWPVVFAIPFAIVFYLIAQAWLWRWIR